MSDKYHRLLTEDAARIHVPPMTWKEVKSKSIHSTNVTRKRNRWLAYGASAATLAIVAVGASGFVSPVMAATLHKIPVIGSLYSFEIPQMNQYASTTDPSATDHGITLSVPKAYYDGGQLSVVYEIQVPQGYQALDVGDQDGSQLSMTSGVIDATLNGKKLPSNNEQWNDTLNTQYTYKGEIDWNLSSDQLPSSGNLTIPIHQIGTVNGNWTLSIPVSRISVDKVTQVQSLKGISSNAYGLTLSAKKVAVDPVFTTIAMEMREPVQADGKPKYPLSYQLNFRRPKRASMP